MRKIPQLALEIGIALFIMIFWMAFISFQTQENIEFNFLNLCILLSLFAMTFWLGLIWQRYKKLKAGIEEERKRKAAAPPAEHPPAQPALPLQLTEPVPTDRTKKRTAAATAPAIAPTPQDEDSTGKAAVWLSVGQFIIDLLWISAILVVLVWCIAVVRSKPVNLDSAFPSLSSIIISYSLFKRFRLWNKKMKVTSEPAATPPPSPTASS